jgi:hypothetical protein
MRWLGLVGVIVIAGCSGASNRPATYPVTGVVVLDGAPVAGADVSFAPTDASGKPARGRTDAEGKFSLKTYFGPKDDAEGALPGEYKLTVRKIEEKVGFINPEKQRPPKSQLPAHYADAAKSDLSATVLSEGPNHVDVALTK